MDNVNLKKYLVKLKCGIETTVKAKCDEDVLTEIFWNYCYTAEDIESFTEIPL